MNDYLKEAKISAEDGMNNNEGGPFGACIIKDNKIISVSHNTVLKDNDPTAHAEVNAIREACKKLNTFDLTGCTLYATSEPCPMCLSAIIWSNIKEVYYANTKEETSSIGFRDDNIYKYLNNKDDNVLNIKKIDNEECKELLNNYKNTIY